MKKENVNLGYYKQDTARYLIRSLFILAILTVVMLCMFSKVEFEGKMTCNSGFVGLKGDLNKGNITHLTLNNIDGMNCYADVKGRFPLIALLGGGQ